jgi:hypothetical protein
LDGRGTKWGLVDITMNSVIFTGLLVFIGTSVRALTRQLTARLCRIKEARYAYRIFVLNPLEKTQEVVHWN